MAYWLAIHNDGEIVDSRKQKYPEIKRDKISGIDIFTDGGLTVRVHLDRKKKFLMRRHGFKLLKTDKDLPAVWVLGYETGMWLWKKRVVVYIFEQEDRVEIHDKWTLGRPIPMEDEK